MAVQPRRGFHSVFSQRPVHRLCQSGPLRCPRVPVDTRPRPNPSALHPTACERGQATPGADTAHHELCEDGTTSCELFCAPLNCTKSGSKKRQVAAEGSRLPIWCTSSSSFWIGNKPPVINTRSCCCQGSDLWLVGSSIPPEKMETSPPLSCSQILSQRATFNVHSRNSRRLCARLRGGGKGLTGINSPDRHLTWQERSLCAQPVCEEFISQREMALKGLFEMDKESQSK